MIQRGEIYFVDLNPVKGREQGGNRPVAVLSIDRINRQPLVITVVIGTNGANVERDYLSNVRLSVTETGLPMETVFLGFQIRSLDEGRFPSAPAGRLTAPALLKVEKAVQYSLGLH